MYFFKKSKSTKLFDQSGYICQPFEILQLAPSAAVLLSELMRKKFYESLKTAREQWNMSRDHLEALCTFLEMCNYFIIVSSQLETLSCAWRALQIFISQICWNRKIRHVQKCIFFVGNTNLFFQKIKKYKIVRPNPPDSSFVWTTSSLCGRITLWAYANKALRVMLWQIWYTDMNLYS